MNQVEKPLPQLTFPRTNIVGENAFDGDKLGRRQLGERLTGYVDRLREGAVLAIDAPWGEGKTWFGRNWAKSLKDQGHKVIFIDAFEQDYIEDPFLLITAEIAEMLDDGQGASKEFKERAAGVIKAILPIGTKVLLNLAGKVAIGSADLSKDLAEAAETAQHGATDAASQWIEKRFDEHTQEKKSLQSFRVALTAFAAKQDKPVVLFIDELDRCRPSFSVRLIERVKHFFDVPNLVFVLLLNREQLETAVKGVYGQETDAASYLGKFVNFFFRLPKRTSMTLVVDDHVKSYVSHVFDRYNFGTIGGAASFKEYLSLLATGFNLSLRDIERAMALFAFAQPLDSLNHLLAYVITIKIAKPPLFKALCKGDVEAHKIAKHDIDTLIKKIESTGARPSNLLNMLSELHNGHLTTFDSPSETLQRLTQNLWFFNVSLDELFPFVASKIDLPIEG